MALTRKYLKAMGIEDEKIDQIIEAHTETVDVLKQERDAAKNSAAEVEAITKERDTIKAQLAKAGDAAKVQAEFDAYKKQIAGEKTDAAKRDFLAAALRKEGMRDSAIKLVLKNADLSKVEMDGEKPKSAAELVKTAKAEYADLFGTVETRGQDGGNPLTGGGTIKTKDDIFKIKDAGERQKAISEHLELFQKGSKE